MFHDVRELTELTTKVAQCATAPITVDAARKLAEVSRQTPREALRLGLIAIVRGGRVAA